MERKPDESFAAYKERRAAANFAVKNINRRSNIGGSISVRAEARRHRSGKHAGAYGKILASHFAKQRATPALLAAHKSHVEHMAARKARRATNADLFALAA